MARVLIVDDEEGMRSTLRRFLELDGHEVATAEDADRALTALAGGSVDVLVSDIIMPRLGGVELLKHVRAVSPDTKIILITGEPTVETAAEALRSGAFDYLAKPVSRGTLNTVVSAASRVKALEDENRRYHLDLERLVAERTRQIEEYSRRLEDIAAGTRTFAVCPDVESLAPRILHLLARNLDAGGGSIFLEEGGRLRLLCSLDPGHQPREIEAPAPRSVIGAVLERRQALLVRDIRTEDAFKSSGWSGYADGSLLGLPCLDSEGNPRAVITLHNKTSPPFTPHDLNLGRIIASHAIEAIRNIELTRSLVQSEANYRNFAEHSGVGILLQQDGRLVYANARIAAMLGCGPGELPADTLASLVHPEDRALLADVERTAADDATVRREIRLTRRDGSLLWTDVSLSVCAFRRRPAVMANVVDVTERRRAEAETRRYAENMRLVNELTLEFAAAPPTTDPYAFIAGTVQSFTGARGSLIATFEPDGTTLVVRHASAAPGVLPRVAAQIGREPVGANLTVPADELDRMMREVVSPAADPAMIALGTAPCITAAALQDLMGAGSLIGMGLSHGGDPIGAICLFLPPDADMLPAEVIHPIAHLAAITLRRRKLEEQLRGSEDQLRQAQKMESIGRLAGGVAHDFNNLLTVITGNADLARRQLPEGSPILELVDEVLSAAGSAVNLTRQLLTFSRKQVVIPRLVRPGELLEGMRRMLRRLIGEDLALEVSAPGDLARVCIDPGQLEQVVVNLAVNARDAMPDGGRLSIAAANVELAAKDSRAPAGLKPGRYVELRVQDTGTGMSEDVKRHLFEPFFTTKPTGRGTGLGLATIYGIVKQNAGAIDVDSAPGRGTTFRILLPAADGEETPGGTNGVAHTEPLGTETVLYVEDNDTVRRVTQTQLAMLGYTVLSFPDGEAALAGTAGHPGTIHLLVTDVIMPVMNGRMLAARIAERRPGIRILYLSGYTDDVIGQQGILEAGTCFLAKPFNLHDLAVKIRETLDQVPGGTSAAGNLDEASRRREDGHGTP
jgi:PAS domain S-box-containing protein